MNQTFTFDVLRLNVDIGPRLTQLTISLDLNCLNILGAIDADDLVLLIETKPLAPTSLYLLVELVPTLFSRLLLDEHLVNILVETQCADPLLERHIVDRYHTAVGDQHVDLIVEHLRVQSEEA